MSECSAEIMEVQQVTGHGQVSLDPNNIIKSRSGRQANFKLNHNELTGMSNGQATHPWLHKKKASDLASARRPVCFYLPGQSAWIRQPHLDLQNPKSMTVVCLDWFARSATNRSVGNFLFLILLDQDSETVVRRNKNDLGLYNLI